MKLATFLLDGKPQVGALTERGLVSLPGAEATDLGTLLRRGVSSQELADMAAAGQRAFDPALVRFLPPLIEPPKIICVGLNYADHTKESPYEQPTYPTLFFRVATSLCAHGEVIERPHISDTLDFEGEMVVVLGQGGRHIPKEQALDCVFGYSVANEGSVREYQFKSPQWTVGKNFDRTCAIGPYVVTADELPAGGKGLKLQTRLNGEVVQSASTDDMIYDVATLISVISEAITLQPGDVIVSGTPAGVGFGRNPKLYMKDGDRVEVEIERIGTLVNTVRDEQPARA